MITKDYITELKHRGNSDIANLVAAQRDVSSINFILENLGQLPTDFHADFLYNLLKHQHSQVRLNAVKNIGKLNGESDVKPLIALYQHETDTNVRREIVLSIGRQRKCANKPLLYGFLDDEDPKIVCQAIRGLLVFENDKEVEEHLRPLVNHPNEMVRTVIYKEYFAKRENYVLNESISKVINNERKYTFVCGDSLEILQTIPDESINCVVTSPPYWNLREYDVAENSNVIGNEPDYHDYVKSLTEIFSEIKRILTKDGSLWLNLGDKYYNKELLGMPWRVALSLMSNGWILRNDVIWDQMKGTQSSKDRLRDVYEHIFHFVKSKSYYYAHNEIRIAPIRKAKMYNGEIVSATGVSGKKYRKQIAESTFLSDEEKNEANKALDEILQDLSNGKLVDFRMTIRGEQRAFHSDNTTVSGRAKELETKGFYFIKMGANGHLPSDIWRIAPEDTWRKDAHYAVFPEELLLNPIKATCPDGGIVLDPFSGTGSTVVTAVKLNRRGIGIDLSEYYTELANRRMKYVNIPLF
jgi:DNA modification methylase